MHAAYMHICVQLNYWKSKYKAAGKAKWAKFIYINRYRWTKEIGQSLKKSHV